MRRSSFVLVLALALAAACSEPVDPARDPGSDRPDATSDSGETETGPDDADAQTDADVATPDADAQADADVATPDATIDVPDVPDAVFEQTFVVATWNVARFFDTVCDSGTCGADAFEEIPSPAQFRVKVNTVADAIATLNADIVLLQEVESAACLDALVEALDGAYNVAVLGETGFAASLDVAVLARGELLEVVRHGDARIPRPGGGTTSFAREFLEIRLRVAGNDLSVFNAHFKSQAGDDPSRRLAEALAAREIVLDRVAAAPDHIVILGGDLNDTPGSDPMNALLEDGLLLRVAEELVPNDGTVEYRGVRNALDHLLLGVESGGAFVPGSAEIVRDRSPGYRGSDHSPLRATFGVATELP